MTTPDCARGTSDLSYLTGQAPRPENQTMKTIPSESKLSSLPRNRGASRWGLGVVLLAGVLGGGCGASKQLGPQMAQLWQWDGGVEASRVLRVVEKADIPQNVPAAVGVTGRGLVGRTLPDGEVWTYEGGVDVLPTLVADAVLFSGDGKVTMLDVRTGKTRFSVDANQRRLEGAGYDGEKAVLLLVDKNNAREDQIRVIGSGGRSYASFSSVARIGTPAAVNGIGLVPYNGQYVGGFDLDTGELLGRILLRDGLHTVRTENGGVTLFGAGATRLSGKVTSSPDSQSLKLAPRKLPGEPIWPVDGSKPRPARSEPIGIYAAPNQSAGSLSFAGNRYAATYFEIAIGLEQGSNAVSWSTHFKRAVSGAAAGKTGTTVCLEDGHIVHLGWKDGNQLPLGSLETRLKACAVSPSEEKVAAGGRPALFDQIVETLTETGPDMVTMQMILIDELAQVPSSETTQALLAIAQNPLVATDLSEKAAQLISKQDQGSEEMLEALRASAPTRPETTPKETEAPKAEPTSEDPNKEESTNEDSDDWIDENDTENNASEKTQVGDPSEESVITGTIRTLRPPPISALAKALTRMKTPGAAEALAPYLGDASLAPKDVASVMSAITQLGSQTQVEAVHHFLSSYKNTGGGAELIKALEMAAGFLYAHQDDAANETLKKELAQSLTHPILKKRTANLVQLAAKYAPDALKARHPASEEAAPEPKDP